MKFEQLTVWQKALDLSAAIHSLTRKFPKEEQYVLTSQLRRAVVSIPSNISEGKGRNSKKEYIQFLYISRGSAFESMTLIQLSEKLGYLTKKQTDELLTTLNEISAMLSGLIRSQENL